MARSDQLRTAQAQSWADQVAFVSFHDDDPGTDGSNDLGITHIAVTWPDAADAGTILSASVAAALDAGTVLAFIGLWDDSSNYLDSMQANLTFEQATTYNFQVRYTENEESA